MHTTKNTFEEDLTAEMVRTMEPFHGKGIVGLAILSAVILFGLAAYLYQLYLGLAATHMRDYVSWGMYMSNFVFFIGISHAGTLISAILRVTNAKWRRPITRMAEAITLFALVVGASMVIIDMGRPDRIMNVLIYGRLQSPILWDFCAISTYLSGSLLYLYVAMIPDMAILSAAAERHHFKPWRKKLYSAMSLGYRNTKKQERRLNIALATMAVIIIPVAVSVHTVVSWIFAMTLRPGWHSTIFGPYFVVGAIYSGTAAIIVAIEVFRHVYKIEHHLTDLHQKLLGKLLLALVVIYAYFTFSEYLTAWYGGESSHQRLLQLLMGAGKYGGTFWGMVAVGMLIPFLLIIAPGRWKVGRIVAASIFVNIGMWVKRYLIIVPTMETPYIPAHSAGDTISYFPSWVEWAITAAALAMFILLYALFSKVFPILSIWEVTEDAEEAAEKEELLALKLNAARSSTKIEELVS